MHNCADEPKVRRLNGLSMFVRRTSTNHFPHQTQDKNIDKPKVRLHSMTMMAHLGVFFWGSFLILGFKKKGKSKNVKNKKNKQNGIVVR